METFLDKEMTVCVVDSGYDKTHPLLNNIEVVGYEYINGEVVQGKCKDYIGHGTAIIGIMSKLLTNTKFVMIKIFNDKLEVIPEKLIFAMSYIYNNINCHVVHLSLGTNFYNDELYNICKKITDKNVKIVSAFDNFGGISYPAAFDNVIGVDVSNKCKKNNEFIIIKGSPVNIVAKGGVHRVAWIDSKYIISEGISFSAAYVTAHLVKYMQRYGQDCNAMEMLEKTALETYCLKSNTLINKKERFYPIKKAAICPLNKETMSLVNFPDMLPFDIVKIYESKYSGKVGSTYNAFRTHGHDNIEIDNFENIDFSKFDTMILGHVAELSNLLGRDIKKEIIEKCLQYKINIYCFDNFLVDSYREKFYEQGCWVDSADIVVDQTFFNKKGKLYSIQSPVVGIFGTSQRQGKFTLQLLLRKWFQDKGYILGQMGTEPQSALFHMDEIFPFGYEAQMHLSGDEQIEYLNFLMHKIDRKKVDLIIVGCQSGFVPANYYNVFQYPVNQINFLLGTLPDVIVLCVNVFDETEYIKRTILAMESLADSKVIALVISKIVPDSFFRKRMATEEEIAQCAIKLKAEIGILVFTMDEREISKLGVQIVDFLSSV